MKSKLKYLLVMLLVGFITPYGCGGASGAGELGDDIDVTDDSIQGVVDDDAQPEETDEDGGPLIGDATEDETEEEEFEWQEDDSEVDGGAASNSNNDEADDNEDDDETVTLNLSENLYSNYKEMCPDFNLELPIEHTYGDDGRLYALVNGEQFITEFGAWGAHGGGHTGHLEGDGKTNWSIHIRPDGQMKEVSGHMGADDGDGDGICEVGEICGVTAATALTNAPWYIAKHEGMQLTGVTAVTDQGNMQDYVTGEGMEWMLAFQVCGINLNMFHIGQLSDELNTLLVERFGEEVLTNPGNVEFYWLSIEPMDIPQGMPLARPQVTFSFSDEVDGETYYYAHAQMEWTANDSFACDDISGYCGTCAYAMFSEEDQNDLQGALDRNLIEPISYGRFLKYNPSTGDPASIFAAAHSELCAVDSFVLENTPETMATLFDNNSYSWLDKPMSTHARDYFAIYEIKKGGAAYEEVREYYTNDDVSYMIVRDIVDDTTGLPSGYFGAFGEVLSITDDGGEGTFIVRTRNENTLPESDMSQYFAARYRLESDKLLVHWGESSFFQDDVVVPEPEPIPQSVTCNGEPTFCYDHDFSEFYN